MHGFPIAATPRGDSAMHEVVIDARAPVRRGLPAAAFLTLSASLWAASLALKGSIVAVAVAVAVAIAGLVLGLVWRRRLMAQSLWVRQDSVSLRSAGAITKTIARPDSIHRSLVHYQRYDPGVDTLIIRNRSGDGLRLTAVSWPIDEVEAALRRLGFSLSTEVRDMTASQIVALGLAPRWYAHIYLTAVCTVVVLSVLIGLTLAMVSR